MSTAKSRHGAVGAKMLSDIEESPAWNQLLASYRDIGDEYTALSEYKLFASPELPIILLKPYESVLNKSFRKNVLLNRNWPRPPRGGWITPANWYEQTNDIVRTSIVVKYLDGVEFIIDRIREIAESHARDFSVDYEARDEGYYAAHCYITFEVDVPRINWDTEILKVRLEIQITTQLQDVIRKLTHDYYEIRRSQQPLTTDTKWQWDYASSEFVPNYLGHILHYVEGMIMEVRMRGKVR